MTRAAEAAASEPVARIVATARTSAKDRARTRGVTGQSRWVARCQATIRAAVASRPDRVRMAATSDRVGDGDAIDAIAAMTRSGNASSPVSISCSGVTTRTSR